MDVDPSRPRTPPSGHPTDTSPWVPDASVRGAVGLALHRLIAERLAADPGAVLAAARRNLATMRRANDDGSADGWLDAWEVLLDGPLDRLTAVMVDPRQAARDLRQSSPFAGVLSPKERWAALRRVRRRGGAPRGA